MSNCPNVLIYGFGWSGKALLHLCESFGLICKVVDDNLEIFDDEKFLNFDSCLQNRNNFALFLIAISGKPEISQKIYNKLVGGGVSADRIRHISLDGYNENFAKFFWATYKSAEGFLKSLLEDTQDLENFSTNFAAIKKLYKDLKAKEVFKDYQRRIAFDDEHQGLSVIAKIHTTSSKNMELLNYPGFSVLVDLNAMDKNFFFKERIDFSSLQKRDRGHKVIAIFGPSTVREDYLQFDETLVFLLRQRLKDNQEKYSVLNFGMSGYTLYEQFLLYASLGFCIKPDFVISFFFGVDISIAKVNCPYLLENFSMIYHPQFEKSLKRSSGSTLPLYYQLWQGGEGESLNTQQKILEAIALRLEQFDSMVSSYGGRFIPIISPLLECKKHWSEEEIRGYNEGSKSMLREGNYSKEESKQSIDALKAMSLKMPIYDMNCCFENSCETLFLDWIHPNKRGNEIIIENLLTILNCREV